MQVRQVLDTRTGNYRPATIDQFGRPTFLVTATGADFQPEPPAPPVQQTHIYLRGPIRGTDEQGDDGFWAAPVVAQIQSSPVGAEIHLHIDSRGGDFQATREIIDALADRTELKVAHIDGVCYSGAFLIALACDQRDMSAHATVMTHGVHRGGCVASTTEKTEWCVGFIARRCPQIPMTRIRAWLNRNNSDGDGVWLDARSALELGIATSIWVDSNPRKEIPPALRPFNRESDTPFLQCQCAKCKARRASSARQPISVPKPKAIGRGFMVTCAADFKPGAVAGPQDAAREALRREAAGRFKTFEAAQTRRIKAMSQG